MSEIPELNKRTMTEVVASLVVEIRAFVDEGFTRTDRFKQMVQVGVEVETATDMDAPVAVKGIATSPHGFRKEEVIYRSHGDAFLVSTGLTIQSLADSMALGNATLPDIPEHATPHSTTMAMQMTRLKQDLESSVMINGMLWKKCLEPMVAATASERYDLKLRLFHDRETAPNVFDGIVVPYRHASLAAMIAKKSRFFNEHTKPEVIDATPSKLGWADCLAAGNPWKKGFTHGVHSAEDEELFVALNSAEARYMAAALERWHERGRMPSNTVCNDQLRDLLVAARQSVKEENPISEIEIEDGVIISIPACHRVTMRRGTHSYRRMAKTNVDVRVAVLEEDPTPSLVTKPEEGEEAEIFANVNGTMMRLEMGTGLPDTLWKTAAPRKTTLRKPSQTTDYGKLVDEKDAKLKVIEDEHSVVVSEIMKAASETVLAPSGIWTRHVEPVIEMLPYGDLIVRSPNEYVDWARTYPVAALDMAIQDATLEFGNPKIGFDAYRPEDFTTGPDVVIDHLIAQTLDMNLEDISADVRHDMVLEMEKEGAEQRHGEDAMRIFVHWKRLLEAMSKDTVAEADEFGDLGL